MKKNIVIELLGDRIGVDTQVTSPELLKNSNFTNGNTGSSQFAAGFTPTSNYATSNAASPDWDLDCGVWSNATRQFTWNSAGWLQKTVTGPPSRFRQVMELGAGVAYTCTMRFKNWSRSGTIGLVSHGMAAPGQPQSVGANVIFTDPSNDPPYGLGVGAGGNPNVNVGYGGGRPNNSIGTLSNPDTWHESTVIWRQANNSTTDALTFQMDALSTVTIDWIRLSRVDMNQSLLIGELDGANPEDSPLSLNFAINSPTNIEARAGAYSKTFQIPATPNNNHVLKRMNITNSTHSDSALRFQTPCRISMGGLFAIDGLFKVQDVIRIKEKAIAYSCVFFGDNLGWSTGLENKFINQLTFPNSTNLKVCARDIMATWTADDATQITEYDGTVSTNTSPIIYPFATYGPTNETGQSNSMQILREYWERYTPTVPSTKTGCYFYGTAHMTDPTPLPVLDWRPMLWVYPMIKEIFDSIGYSIVSNFIESSDFKKLLYATPNALYQNPDARFLDYSNMNNFNSNAPLTVDNLRFSVTSSSQSISYTWPNPLNPDNPDAAEGSFNYDVPMVWNAIYGTQCRYQNVLQNSTIITHGGTYSYMTIGEAGYYNLKCENFCWGYSGSTWNTAAGSGGNNALIKFGPGLGFRVQSVGNTAWHDVAVNTKVTSHNCLVKNAGQTGSKYLINFEDVDFTGYFNKGDKLRLFVRVDWHLDGDGPSAGATTTISGCTWRCMGSELDNISNANPSVQGSNAIMEVTLINPDRLEYGQTYDLADIIPTEHEQLEFVKGIAHSFNLQFQTSEKTKTVYIEPFSEFYQPLRTAIDWTAKLDRGKEIVDSWIDSNFTRKLIFKYKTDDNDAMIENLAPTNFDGVEDYEPYIQYLNSAYPSGDTVFENPFFSGTFDSQKFAVGGGVTSGNNNFYSAALWTNVGGTSEKGFGFSPRLLMYDKKDFGIQNLTDMDGNYVNYNTGRNWHGQYWRNTDTGNYYNAWVGWADTTVGASFPPAPFYGANPPYLPFGYNWSHAFLPQCTFIDRFNFTNQFGLSYGNYTCQDYEYDGNLNGGTGGQSYGAMGTGLGLYHRYYKTMIDGLIDQPKLRTCYIDLKVTDILNLDFSFPIYIDGVYYKLIKIVDYQPHFNTSTEVQLHQYSPEVGAGIPQAPALISTATPVGGVVITGSGGTYGPPAPAPPPPEL